MATLLVTQAVSLAGVLVLIGFAWSLGFRKRAAVLDDHHVRHLAREDAAGEPAEIAVDVLGRSALAQLDAERVFVVKAVGDRLTTRVFPRAMLARVRMYRPKGQGIGARLRFSDLGFDDLKIEFREREAPPFIERLRRGARGR
jgi:hypothetical protein